MKDLLNGIVTSHRMFEVVRCKFKGIVTRGVMDYAGKPERGIFFRLKAYKRVEVSQAEKQKKVGNTSIEVLERLF